MQRRDERHNKCTGQTFQTLFSRQRLLIKRKRKTNRIIFFFGGGDEHCCRRCVICVGLLFRLASLFAGEKPRCCVEGGSERVCRVKKVDRCHADVNKYNDNYYYYYTSMDMCSYVVYLGRHDRKCSCQTRARRLFFPFYFTQLFLTRKRSDKSTDKKKKNKTRVKSIATNNSGTCVIFFFLLLFSTSNR